MLEIDFNQLGLLRRWFHRIEQKNGAYERVYLAFNLNGKYSTNVFFF